MAHKQYTCMCENFSFRWGLFLSSSRAMRLNVWLNKWATAYVRSQTLQLFMCFVVFLACGNYVTSTYFRTACNIRDNINRLCRQEEDAVVKQALAIIELFVVLCFIFDFTASSFYYPSFLEYCSSFYGMVDFVVMLPSNLAHRVT